MIKDPGILKEGDRVDFGIFHNVEFKKIEGQVVFFEDSFCNERKIPLSEFKVLGSIVKQIEKKPSADVKAQPKPKVDQTGRGAPAGWIRAVELAKKLGIGDNIFYELAKKGKINMVKYEYNGKPSNFVEELVVTPLVKKK